MAQPRLVNLVRWYTTPDRLREIADILERRWRRTQLGEEIPKHIEFGYAVDTEVHLIIDQDEMHRLVREGKAPDSGIDR